MLSAQRLLLMLALVLCALPVVWAQSGSNYDPPPRGYYDAPPPPPIPDPPPAPPPEPPFWRQIDYADPANLVKIALLLGSVIIARRAFHEMKDE
ncbi:MAG: hypothetical protein KJZ79_14865 [Bryobacteraceae bacterium]|nr:hypothetical protein [Bryobacteraceae bacterium]